MSIVFVVSADENVRQSVSRAIHDGSSHAMDVNPNPEMAGPWLRMIGHLPLEQTHGMRSLKARSIQAHIDAHQDIKVFVDINPLFLYTYFDTLNSIYSNHKKIVLNIETDLANYACDLNTQEIFTPVNTAGRYEKFWPTWPQSLCPLDPLGTYNNWDVIAHHAIDFERRIKTARVHLQGQVEWVDIGADGPRLKEFEEPLIDINLGTNFLKYLLPHAHDHDHGIIQSHLNAARGKCENA
jgi:hypothetical protein